MPGAVEPGRNDGLGVRLARCHVLADGAPTVSGAGHTLGGLAAVGTAVAHVIVGGHVGGVRSGGLRQSRGQRERMGCAEPLPAATAVLLARVVDELEHPRGNGSRVVFSGRRERRRQHEPKLVAANVRADRGIRLVVDLVAETVGEDLADRRIAGGTADVDGRRARGPITRLRERRVELRVPMRAPTPRRASSRRRSSTGLSRSPPLDSNRQTSLRLYADVSSSAARAVAAASPLNVPRRVASRARPANRARSSVE